MTCNASTETKVTALILLWKPPWCMHKHKDQKMFPSSWPCTSACSEVVFMVIMEMSCLAGQWKPGFNNTLITSLFSFFSHQFIAFRWNLNFLIYLYYWTVLQAATILVDMASTLWGKILASKFWLRDHSFFTAAGWVGGLKDFCTRWSHGSQVGQRGDQSSLTECKGGLYGKIFGL